MSTVPPLPTVHWDLATKPDETHIVRIDIDGRVSQWVHAPRTVASSLLSRGRRIVRRWRGRLFVYFGPSAAKLFGAELFRASRRKPMRPLLVRAGWFVMSPEQLEALRKHPGWYEPTEASR